MKDLLSDPITLVTICLIVFSLTGHIAVPWWQIVFIYAVLICLALMAKEEG